MTDYAKIAAAVRKDACGDYPDKCRTCGARKNCGSIRIHKAAEAIDQLVQIHQLDLSELVRLRRKIQALLEDRSAEHCSASHVMPSPRTGKVAPQGPDEVPERSEVPLPSQEVSHA